MPSLRSLLSAALLLVVTALHAAEYISVRGSVVVARVLDAVASDIQRKHDIEFKVAVDSSSGDAIRLMILGVTDMAAVARRMTPEETSERPEKRCVETIIGYQALGVVVSDELWQAGIRALSKEDMRALYEGEIINWKHLGGPDKPVKYFNREATFGVWDHFMLYLYGDLRKAPLSKAETIDNPREVKLAVQLDSNTFSWLEMGNYAPGDGIRAVGIKMPDGSIIEPTKENLANGRYPLMRPLVLITNKVPTGKLRDLVDYMLGPEGQNAIRRAGNLAIKDLEAK